ncbi:MAG: hypothetical protein WC682_00700 [Parcubacteria group bacterium]|jgi:hypothetical protein
MTKKLTRAEVFGINCADVIMEAAHMRYNAPSGKSIVASCIKRLQERIDELQSVSAKPAYKKARYGKKDEE